MRNRINLSLYIKTLLLFAVMIHASCNESEKLTDNIQPNKVLPSKLQIDYQQMEVVGFIHFSINTFTGKEWDFGDESPEVFNPSELNVEQWVLAAKEGGLKQLILTAKHHDGFCLWPSKYTEHSIKNSPYKNGEGDIVKEFVDACRKHNIKVGLYLSPWDRNYKDYGKQAYLDYYHSQLKELLSNYGEINEIWFDGANGGDGYYGGANETRKIESKTYYKLNEIFAFVKELQPNIKIFSDAGPDIRWIGNEQGYAGDPFWSPINIDSLVIGKADTQYLNTGDPMGNMWIVGQCDVSIRPGWFYHPEEDNLVKTPEQLMDIYYKSVGRNALLLLNIPPDKRGLFHENDIKALKEFKYLIDKTFEDNLAENASISATNYRLNDKKFAPENILDSKNDSYWATDDSVTSADFTVQLSKEKLFDVILLQEPIKYGQRISEFIIEIEENGNWQPVFEGTTIGYKRLIKIDPVNASKIRVRILKANNTIAISNVEIFKSVAPKTIVEE